MLETEDIFLLHRIPRKWRINQFFLLPRDVSEVARLARGAASKSVMTSAVSVLGDDDDDDVQQ